MSQEVKTYKKKYSSKKYSKYSSKKSYSSSFSFKSKNQYYEKKKTAYKSYYSSYNYNEDYNKENDANYYNTEQYNEDSYDEYETIKYKKNYLNQKTLNHYKEEKKLSYDQMETSTSCKSTNSSIAYNDETSSTQPSSPISKEDSMNLAQKKKLRNKFDIPEPKHRNSLTLNTKSNLNLLSLKENTIILSIKVKVSANETATFQLRKYDDLFITVKLFCEINHIKEELIKPIIIKSLQALNQIYTAMNTPLSDEDIYQLKLIKSNM